MIIVQLIAVHADIFAHFFGCYTLSFVQFGEQVALVWMYLRRSAPPSGSLRRTPDSSVSYRDGRIARQT